MPEWLLWWLPRFGAERDYPAGCPMMLQRLLAWIVEQCRSHAWIVVLFGIVLAGFSAIYSAGSRILCQLLDSKD